MSTMTQTLANIPDALIEASLLEEIWQSIEDLSADEQMGLIWYLLQKIPSEDFSNYLVEEIDIDTLSEMPTTFDMVVMERIHRMYGIEVDQLEKAERQDTLIEFAMKKKTHISFDRWSTQSVEKVFNLKETYTSARLSAWLESAETIPPQKKEMLEQYKAKLKKWVSFWNEEELKMKFIAPLIDLVDYDSSETYRSFYERYFSLEVNGVKVRGTVDFVIAEGKQEPDAPYFCIHEYKKESGNKADPRGQLLVEMVSLNQENLGKIPIYGAYVLGRNWFFVILEGKEYTVSEQFDATKDDIYTIYHTLGKVKEYLVVPKK